MAFTEWMIRGPEITTCSCSYGCPCQFNALPTDGYCRAAVGMQIDKGHYGKVKLDGLHWAATAAWPGPIHMGHGEIQPIVDERATPEQREALLKIMSGQDTEPGATFFNVFVSMCDTVHHADVQEDRIQIRHEDLRWPCQRAGRGGSNTEAIRNPVTGKPIMPRFRCGQGLNIARRNLPAAPINPAPIALDTNGNHAHLAMLHLTGQGVVH